jgi:Uma2 family endonuclease
VGTSGPMTARDFFEWVGRPENVGKRWELVRGQPAELPPWPDGFDAAHLRIVDILSRYVIARGLGSVAFLSDGLITARDPDTVRCPAVMVFLTPTCRDDFPPRFTTAVPQLVVELHPPGESYSRIMRRMIDYVQFGVPLIWGVEPDDRGVSTYQPKRPPHVPDDDDELTGFPSLPDFVCKVRDLFALPGQPSAAPAQP